MVTPVSAGGVRLGGIPVVEVVEVRIDLLVEVLELPLGDVASAVVRGLELAAVDGDELAAEEALVAPEQDESPADLADRFAVAFAEVGDGLEVGGELAQEPNQLEVAAGFPFKQATGADAVEVAVDVELEQRARVLGRSAGPTLHPADLLRYAAQTADANR